jgi:hypothetical protein
MQLIEKKDSESGRRCSVRHVFCDGGGGVIEGTSFSKDDIRGVAPSLSFREYPELEFLNILWS